MCAPVDMSVCVVCGYESVSVCVCVCVCVGVGVEWQTERILQ